MAERSIKSAERTLALFELFSREQDAFTVGYIASALAIPQPSASMLLRNLARLGYLEYDRRRRTYEPSIRVALLGSWVSRRFGLAGELGETVSALEKATHETAFIGIQNGASAQYAVVQHPDRTDRLMVASGQYRSLTFSAIGRVLLSIKEDAEVLTWVRRCNAEATQERFRIREGRFLELIAGVRQQGFAESYGDVTEGLGAIAVSIDPPMGQQPLALGVGGPIPRLREKRELILEKLLRAKAHFDRAGVPTNLRP